jgi:uncharacterized protein (DUF58 family)
VYILPTRSGVVAAALMFLILLAGLNYNNSLALLLCFTLSGVALVSMYECHRMLVGLKIEGGHIEPAFAGRHGELMLQFANTDSRTRARLTVRCAPCAPARFELPPAAVHAVCLNYPAHKRGRQRLERLEVASDAPLGLFRAWCWLHLPLQTIIYPAPGGTRALPPLRGRASMGGRYSPERGEEDWAWLRPFREGDPPRSVAWKSYAHGGPLLVAQYEAPAGARRLLDSALLADLPLEQRLSQLTQWVLDCEQRGMRLVGAHHGRSLRRDCLEALALYGL